MCPANYSGVDKFKQKTLERLSLKNEKSQTYPIAKEDLIKIRSCPLCGSTSITVLTEVFLNYSLNFFSTAACNKCSFTFRNISPSLSWFKKCWQKIKSSKLEVFKPEEERARKKRYLEYYDMIKRYHSSGKLLDIGAAFGTGANVFKEKGFNVETVEPEINKVNYIKKVFKLPVVSRSIEDLFKKKKLYDVIIFSHCLEHLDHPEKVMLKLRKFLNREGLLYVEIPLLNASYVTWCDALYMPHKSNFTVDNLSGLMRQSGFKIIETYFDGTFNFGYLLKAIGTKGGQKEELKNRARNKKGNGKSSIDKVRKLYRRGWPLGAKPKHDIVIRYSVPRIEQFFQIVKLDKSKLVKSEVSDKYYTFAKSI